MERKELFVTDLTQAFDPSEAISLDKVDNEKWNVTEYETTEYSCHKVLWFCERQCRNLKICPESLSAPLNNPSNQVLATSVLQMV